MCKIKQNHADYNTNPDPILTLFRLGTAVLEVGMKYRIYKEQVDPPLLEKAMRLIFHLWPPAPDDPPTRFHFQLLETPAVGDVDLLDFETDLTAQLIYEGGTVPVNYSLKRGDDGELQVWVPWIEELLKASAKTLRSSQFCYELYQEARETAYVGLKVGDVTPLYYGIRYFLGSRFLSHHEIRKEARAIINFPSVDPDMAWVKAQLRDALLREPHRPKDVPPAQKKRSQTEAVRRSKAIRRRVDKFEKYKVQYGDASTARKQILMETEESTRLEPDLKQSVLREVEKRLGQEKRKGKKNTR